jgi:hypothetical protein
MYGSFDGFEMFAACSIVAVVAAVLMSRIVSDRYDDYIEELHREHYLEDADRRRQWEEEARKAAENASKESKISREFWQAKFYRQRNLSLDLAKKNSDLEKYLCFCRQRSLNFAAERDALRERLRGIVSGDKLSQN